jgi:hypothetical protein
MGVPARRDTGIRVPVSPPTDETVHVLTDVVLRRHQQIAQWGHNENMSDGTGPDVPWLGPNSNATEIEAGIREAYDRKVQAEGVGALTWVDILLEEMCEAFMEDDPAKLYSELADVVAVGVSWMEKIRQR